MILEQEIEIAKHRNSEDRNTKNKTGYPEHDASAGGPLAESALHTDGRTYGQTLFKRCGDASKILEAYMDDII